jgi:hypothetical protein
MERASFSLGRQALACRRTLILIILREMEGLQGYQPYALSMLLVQYSLCIVSSHMYPARTHPPTLDRALAIVMLCD